MAICKITFLPFTNLLQGTCMLTGYVPHTSVEICNHDLTKLQTRVTPIFKAYR